MRDINIELLCMFGYDYQLLITLSDNRLSQLMDDVNHYGKE